MTRPQPPVTPETAPWWDATRERRLTVQRCRSCDNRQLYPRVLCRACHGNDLELVPSTGEGTVLSFSVVHRSPDPQAFAPPYVVALVRLAEGPVLTTTIVDVDPDDVACDQPVGLRWVPLDDGLHLPVFTLTDQES